MRTSLSTLEKLKVYYVELSSLESQLALELSQEAVSKYRGGLKKSRSTKYRITVYRRAIAQMEKVVNASAEIYNNWLYTKNEIERELEILSDERIEINTSIAMIESEVNNANGLNYQAVTAKAMEFSKISSRLLELNKQIETLKKELIKHVRKTPSYARSISKDVILRDMENEARSNHIPEALDIIVRTAAQREENPIQTDAEFALKMKGVNTDISAIYELQPGGDLELEIEETEIEKAERVEKAALLEREVELALEFQKKEKEKV